MSIRSKIKKNWWLILGMAGIFLLFGILGTGLGIGLTVTGIFIPFGTTVLGLMGAAFLLFLMAFVTLLLISSLVMVVITRTKSTSVVDDSTQPTPVLTPTEQTSPPSLTKSPTTTTTHQPPVLTPIKANIPIITPTKQADQVIAYIIKVFGTKDGRGWEKLQSIPFGNSSNPTYIEKLLPSFLKKEQEERAEDYKIVLVLPYLTKGLDSIVSALNKEWGENTAIITQREGEESRTFEISAENVKRIHSTALTPDGYSTKRDEAAETSKKQVDRVIAHIIKEYGTENASGWEKLKHVIFGARSSLGVESVLSNNLKRRQEEGTENYKIILEPTPYFYVTSPQKLAEGKGGGREGEIGEQCIAGLDAIAKVLNAEWGQNTVVVTKKEHYDNSVLVG